MKNKWVCEVWDIISEMQDADGNTVSDINLLLADSLTSGSTYHRESIKVHIATFEGKTQKEVCSMIDRLQGDILPLSMFIGRPDYRWYKIKSHKGGDHGQNQVSNKRG